ncbi:BTAD domain-containing putative transcriptional regulator [Actinomadura meridiana]|uniref:BTAD domain-containing putative transcriptional regulator n=1 Tax=Actinomadura meridiana TaxID=559626 RepID=A0ABP8CFI3_9ACTN
MTVPFLLLGPLEIHGEDGRLRVPSGRQETVLAALLLDLNRVVSTSSLVDILWAESPPSTARTQVQICVSRIRKTLAPLGDSARITTRNHGYLLNADTDVTDLAVFRHRVARAQTLARDGRSSDAVESLRSAVALWRGPCLDGISSDALARRASTLDEDRLAAVETYLELELDLGRHHRLISELVGLVDEHPLRERLRGYLMLALYRADRQAEALAVYRDGRDVLDRELGLPPSDSLRALESSILTGDPALHLKPRDGDLNGNSGNGNGANVDTPPRPAATPRASPSTTANVPHQLPADIGDFVGRDDFVTEIENAVRHDARRPAPGVAILVGRPGVGKSTTATHVAHRLSGGHFPDGQLYCDLRGTHSDQLRPEEVLRRFLLALGIPGLQLPERLDELAEMYRTLLADRRVLVVLDDAAAEEQITPLIPGGSGCAVIVTSRARLTAVPGAHLIELAALDGESAGELLSRVLGPERVAAERAAAVSLVRAVGGLPLALRIVAARLSARPHWTLASMVVRLGDERRHLDELTHGHMTVRASLSVGYDGLAPVDRRLLRLLSLTEGPTLPGWLAGALLDDPAGLRADPLEPLVDMHMLDVVGIDEAGEFRHRFHETTRMFAREQRLAECSEAEQHDATRRMIGGWMSLVEQAHRRAYGGDHLVLHGTGPRWHPPEPYVRRLLADPLKWLDAELPNLCAAVEAAYHAELDELCWDLATGLVTVFEARGHLPQWESTHRLALKAVRRAGNQRGTAAVLASLGTLYLTQRRLDDAETSLTAALATFDDLDDAEGRGLCLRDLAFAQRVQGHDGRALKLYDQAVDAFDRSGDVVGRASALTQSAPIRVRRGEFAVARVRLDEALAVYRSVGYQRGESLALWRIAQLLMARGELQEAERVLKDVLMLVSANQDVIGTGHVLRDLGEVSAGLGLDQAATRYQRQSLAVWEQVMDPDRSALVRLDMAHAFVRLGRRDEAESLVTECIAAFQDSGMTAELRSARQLLTSLSTG